MTYTPLTVDDVDVVDLTLYDSSGNTTILEVDESGPDYPIMVVGIFEGLDENNSSGKILTARTEIMDKMNLVDDKEPWYKGKAEIYLVSAGTIGSWDKKRAVELVDVNHDGSHWYGRDYNLFEWDTTYWGDYVGIGVIERDGCCRNYSVTITNENYSAKVSATGNDDFIGRVYSVEYDHSNPLKYEPDDVKFYLKY